MLPYLLGFIFLGAGLAALAAQRRWPRLRQLGAGLLVSYVTVALLLGGSELFFRYGYAAPEGQRARENWMARHWQENSLGYRDPEPADPAGRQALLAVGDSFTAGWGLPEVADRFSAGLASRLGDGYAVYNVGKPGAATRAALANLRTYPVKPDIVLWQYFLNDIEDAALSVGQFQEPPPMPAWARESYLGNFVYSLTEVGFGPSYWDWLYARYDDTEGVWAIHQQELNAVVDAVVGEMGARLIVVIFPNMQDAVRSIPYVDRVAQVFEARGVPVLKLFDAVAAWDDGPVIVSPRDAHPSAAFHHAVADMLFEAYFAP